AYGCQVNAMSVENLFEHYARSGFLYAAKMSRLAPFLSLIKENIRRAMRGGELIHYVVSYQDKMKDVWGSVSSWRSTDNGWTIQHLAATSPVASRAVMLSLSVRVHDYDQSH